MTNVTNVKNIANEMIPMNVSSVTNATIVSHFYLPQYKVNISSVVTLLALLKANFRPGSKSKINFE